jgi:hypothetical protein
MLLASVAATRLRGLVAVIGRRTGDAMPGQGFGVVDEQANGPRGGWGREKKGGVLLCRGRLESCVDSGSPVAYFSHTRCLFREFEPADERVPVLCTRLRGYRRSEAVVKYHTLRIRCTHTHTCHCLKRSWCCVDFGKTCQGLVLTVFKYSVFTGVLW